MTKEAIILAGGFGTRLQPIIKDVPKPMALINRKPFLDYLLTWLSSYGVSRIVFAVGYKYDIIKEYFGEDFAGMEILYAVEYEPLGTGGAIMNALEYVNGDSFFVLNGDSFFDIDLTDFHDFCRENETSVGLALKRMEDVSRYGAVEVNGDQRIINFSEKNAITGKGYINAGIYFMKRAFVSSLELKNKFSIEKEVFEKNTDFVEIFGFLSDAYFIDIGIPADYYKAQDDFKKFKY